MSASVRTGLHAVVDRPRSGIVEGQADKTMALEAGQNLVADRLIEHLVKMIEGAEQERQREHVGGGYQRADRRHVGAVEIDGADPGLLDGVLLLAELTRMEHADVVAAAGPLLDQAGHEHAAPARWDSLPTGCRRRGTHARPPAEAPAQTAIHSAAALQKFACEMKDMTRARWNAATAAETIRIGRTPSIDAAPRCARLAGIAARHPQALRDESC